MPRQARAAVSVHDGERGFLDVPENVRASIEASPALRWKAQNVKAWKAGDKSLAPRPKRGTAAREADIMIGVQ